MSRVPFVLSRPHSFIHYMDFQWEAAVGLAWVRASKGSKQALPLRACQVLRDSEDGTAVLQVPRRPRRGSPVLWVHEAKKLAWPQGGPSGDMPLGLRAEGAVELKQVWVEKVEAWHAVLGT